MLLRACSEGDLAEVLQIEKDCATFPWSERQILSSLQSDHYCLGLEIDGVLTGFSLFSLVVDEACLLNIAVSPEQQGKGLGRRLFQSGLNWCVEAGARSCYLEVRVSNLGAQGLYRSMGFQEVGRRKAYYPAAGAREDALIMSRGLPLTELNKI